MSSCCSTGQSFLLPCHASALLLRTCFPALPPFSVLSISTILSTSASQCPGALAELKLSCCGETSCERWQATLPIEVANKALVMPKPPPKDEDSGAEKIGTLHKKLEVLVPSWLPRLLAKKEARGMLTLYNTSHIHTHVHDTCFEFGTDAGRFHYSCGGGGGLLPHPLPCCPPHPGEEQTAVKDAGTHACDLTRRSAHHQPPCGEWRVPAKEGAPGPFSIAWWDASRMACLQKMCNLSGTEEVKKSLQGNVNEPQESATVRMERLWCRECSDEYGGNILLLVLLVLNPLP
eukprot:1161967-Pelagomonas_calceolata.AAC.4